MFWFVLAFILGVLVGWSVTAPTWVKGILTKVVAWVVALFQKKTGT